MAIQNFCTSFREKLATADIKTIKLPKASPHLNGRCERSIQTIKVELLSNLIVFGNVIRILLIDEFVH